MSGLNHRLAVFETSFGRAMLQITNGGTINLEGLRLAGEAEDPQSVRPQGAENYPEPCPREKGTERRFVREHGIWASWRMIGVGGSLGGCDRVTARRRAGKGRVAALGAERHWNQSRESHQQRFGAAVSAARESEAPARQRRSHSISTASPRC